MSNNLSELHDVLQSELRNVEKIFYDSFLENQHELISQVSKHCYGGKRIRCVLLLLFAKMYGSGQVNDAALCLAAAVETIHAATLLHDDVIDNSTVRRFVTTANVIWGNKSSILVGDFLFTKAFELMLKADSLKILGELSAASSNVITGEIMQFTSHIEQDSKHYFDIIKYKTASLFEAACVTGVMSVDHQTCPETIRHVREYGNNLGIAFQVRDDVLDYFGSDGVGKELYLDFKERKITFPVMKLLEEIDQTDKMQFDSVWGNQGIHDVECIMSMMQKYDIHIKALNYISNIALGLCDKIDWLMHNSNKVDEESAGWLKRIVHSYFLS